MPYIEGPEGLYVPEKTGGRFVLTDHDESVGNHLDPLTEHVNKVLGTNFTYNDYVQPDFHLTWGVSARYAYRLVRQFHRSPTFRNLGVLPDAAIGIPRIAKNNTMGVLTGRHPAQRINTVNWYNKNFPNIMKDFHFTSHYYKGGDVVKRTKAEVGVEVGADIVIDDLLEHAILCAKYNIDTILLDKPWNQGEVPPGVTRVRDYVEAADYIDQLPPKEL